MNTTLMRWNLAQAAFDLKDYRAALMHLDDVLTVDSGNLAARELRARALFHSGSLSRAEEEARTILEANPVDEYATLLLARALERQNRHDEAAGVRRQLAAFTGDDRHLRGHQPLG